MAIVPFGDFEPDRKVTDSQVLASGANIVRLPLGWGPQKDFAAGDLVPLPGICRGAYVVSYEGLTRIFAATADDLFEYNFGTPDWDSVKGALTIALDDGATVKFDRRGNWLRACDGTNKLMRFDLTDATTPVFVTTSDAPAGLIQVGSYYDLTVGIYNIGDQAIVAWSDTDDDTTWIDSGSPGLAGEQPLPGGGLATGIAIGETVLVFQRTKTHRFQYTADATNILSRVEIDTGRGALGPDTVCVAGNRIFFISVDGFYAADWSGAVVPIGQDRVNEFFLDACAQIDRPFALAIEEPFAERVLFHYLDADVSGAVYTKMMAYDYSLDKWSPPTDREVQYIMPTITPGTTLEDIEAEFGTLEAFGRSLDSRDLQPSDGLLAAFNASNVYGTLEGDTLAARLRTAPYMEPEGRRVKVSGAYPIGNGMPENWTMTVGMKERLNADPIWSADTAPEPVTGMAMFHVSGRSAEFEMSIPAGEEWTRIEKLDAQSRAEGWR